MKLLSSFPELQSACRLLCEAARETGTTPAVLPDGRCVVFLSASDGTQRAFVVHGSAGFIPSSPVRKKADGHTADQVETSALLSAFLDAARKLEKRYQKGSFSIRWLKADIVTEYASVNPASLSSMIKAPGWKEFFRYGISLDEHFEEAFLEEELNGAGILDYDQGSLSLEALNRYLKKAGRPSVRSIPDLVHPFDAQGFFYEAESGTILPLCTEGQSHGRRSLSPLDDRTVRGLLSSAASWLARQVQEDGSFVYGFYPRFDHVIPGYNCMRHASTIWSLLCQYRLMQDESVLRLVARSLGFLITQAVVFSDPETAFLSEPSKKEIKLGGGAVLILALSEYCEVSGQDTLPLSPEFPDACGTHDISAASKKNQPGESRTEQPVPSLPLQKKDIGADPEDPAKIRIFPLLRALGEGILSLLDREDGTFYHVLNLDFSHKEAYRTVYYDGEAAYALCRLARLFPDEKKWLTAAECAVNHFLSADYTRYRDHWVAYAMNEITRQVRRDDYDTFALRNAQVNLDFLLRRETTYHTFLELLMVTFETWERICRENPALPYLSEFDLPGFLRTIHTRAERMLDGFFFPETAMYMRSPRKVLGTFFVRHDGFRVRIDDVQHNIGGFYLYQKHYDSLCELSYAAPPFLPR